MKQMISICIATLMFAGITSAESTQKASPKYPPSLNKLNDEFMSSFFEFQPSAGTRAGFHQYDTRMESIDAAGVAKQIAIYKKYESRIKALPAKGWSRWAQDDREMLLCFV